MTTTLTTPAELAAHHGWRRVLAVGAHPDDLDFGAASVTVIGDAMAPRTVEEAVYEGLTAATALAERRTPVTA